MATDLIDLIAKTQVKTQPVSLAFQTDNPFATFASAGPAFAQRGADLANQVQAELMRRKLEGLIPEQRKHELAMEGAKRTEIGGNAVAALLNAVNPALGAGAQSDATMLDKERRAGIVKDFGGAAADFAQTPFYQDTTEQVIREAGYDPGQARTLPKIASASAGNPGPNITIGNEVSREGWEIDPKTGRPVKVKTKESDKEKTSTNDSPAPTPRNQAKAEAQAQKQVQANAPTVQQDNTTRSIVQGRSGTKYDKQVLEDGTIIYTREDGETRTVPPRQR